MGLESAQMLSDVEIREAVNSGLRIEPFDEKYVEPASYDIRAGRVLIARQESLIFASRMWFCAMAIGPKWSPWKRLKYPQPWQLRLDSGVR